MNLTQIKIALGAIKRLFYDSRPQKLGGHGKNIYIEYPLMFHNPSNIFLEDNTSIKAFTTVLNTTGKFIMKRNSTAAQNLTVVTGNHHYVKGRFFNDSIKYRLCRYRKRCYCRRRCINLCKCYIIKRSCNRTRMYYRCGDYST